jgi:hypothetical protein
VRLPDFLIIGAMKAGTTTVYRDLLTNPAIFMPKKKEPNNLCDDRVLEESGRAEYAALFADARSDQRCGEASTSYTKRPVHKGVPERALRVCGRELKLIYIMREPVSRIISQHYHSFLSGYFTTGDIDEAVRKHHELIDYSRYGWQLAAWREHFEADKIMAIRLEDFTADRRGWITRICEFLGVEPRPELIDEEVIYNRGDEKPMIQGVWRHVASSRLYARVRYVLPLGLKDRLRALLLPKAPPRPAPPAADTVEYILQELAEDQRQLQKMLNAPAPLWDAEEIRNRYRDKAVRSRE